jgi:hypothetical protein
VIQLDALMLNARPAQIKNAILNAAMAESSGINFSMAPESSHAPQMRWKKVMPSCTNADVIFIGN